MAFDRSHGHTTPGGAVSASNSPGHVDGFVDLEILVDIHESLNESEKSEDTTLATWIKTNYLQDPLVKSRPIRDAEGYANIDKAYRRVRQLTGKAKDEWPFFDTKWKKMSSAAVKNAILGDAAVGAIRSENSGEPRGIPTSNGFRDQHDHTLQTTTSQTTHIETGPNGNQTQKEMHQPPANQSLPRPKTAEEDTRRKDQSPSSKSNSEIGDAAQKADQDTTALDNPLKGHTSPTAEVRDAGAGKVRGRHGRYLNKNEHTPAAANKTFKARTAKKTGTMTKSRGQHPEDEVSISGDAPEATKAITGISSDGNSEGVKGNIEVSTDRQSIDAASNGSDFQPPESSVLAAEAEAVPSNLDRLPPGLTHKKRKSESNIERDFSKRARGTRGGVLGRPRKSATLIERSRTTSEEIVEAGQTPAQPETPLKNSTRRSYRKSAASALESSTPWDPAADVLMNGLGQLQPNNHQSPAMLSNTNASSHGDRTYTEKRASTGSKFKDINEDTVNAAAYTTPKDTPTSQSSRTEQASAPTKQKKRVSFSPDDQAPDVQFFARISTSAGVKDVALSEEDLRSEVTLVKRYAAWQEAGNSDTTFEVFKKIAHFTR